MQIMPLAPANHAPARSLSHGFSGLSLRGPSLTPCGDSGDSANTIFNVDGDNNNTATKAFASYASSILAEAQRSMETLRDDELADLDAIQFEISSRMTRLADDAWKQHFGATLGASGIGHLAANGYAWHDLVSNHDSGILFPSLPGGAISTSDTDQRAAIDGTATMETLPNPAPFSNSTTPTLHPASRGLLPMGPAHALTSTLTCPTHPMARPPAPSFLPPSTLGGSTAAFCTMDPPVHVQWNGWLPYFAPRRLGFHACAES